MWPTNRLAVKYSIRDKFPNIDEVEKETKVKDLLKNAGFKYLTPDEMRETSQSANY